MRVQAAMLRSASISKAMQASHSAWEAARAGECSSISTTKAAQQIVLGIVNSPRRPGTASPIIEGRFYRFDFTPATVRPNWDEPQPIRFGSMLNSRVKTAKRIRPNA
jgi:hypothetical protein